MPKFEVFIPSTGGAAFNMTLRVDAENWMAALKTGMQKLGEQGSSVQNVLVDIQDDNSIHVTESRSGRVFRIRELSEAEAAAAPVKKRKTIPPGQMTMPLPAALAAKKTYDDDEKTAPGSPLRDASEARTEPPPTRASLLERDAVTDPNAPRTESIDPSVVQAGIAAARARAGAAESASASEGIGVPVAPKPPVPMAVERATPVGHEAKPPVATKKKPTMPPRQMHDPDSVVELEHPTRPVVGNIGRPRAPKREVKEQIEDVLAEVFERVQEIHYKGSDEEALYFLLDLALEKIPSESGTVYRADGSTGDLLFSAVRGPKAQELLRSKLTVPAGTGISGFSATEGVSVAVSDVEKDPRFYADISDKLRYDVKSVLCAPMMTHGRTFGCVQLINRKGGATFGEHEVGILSYIAHQGALYLNRRV